MRTFAEYIKNYFKEGFDWKVHTALAVFLSVFIYFNYTLKSGRQSNVYDYMLHTHYKSEASVLYLFVFYAIPFISAALIIRFIGKKKSFGNKKFWIYGLIAMFLIGLDSSYYLMQYANEFLSDNPWIYHWQHACVSNLSSFVTVIIPLFIIYFLVRDFRPELYGFKLNGAKVRPYLWLIVFMIPLIYLASLRPDFLEQYPSYKDGQEYLHMNLSQTQTIGLFELCYGFDFISVELIFRGFLVVGLARFVGKEAVLVMVCVYCFLHFGKPMGEAISSIFGGYILGILALKSKNIFGGLIAHLGVAWGMEFLAFIQS